MSANSPQAPLPLEAPEFGCLVELRPGVFWLRLPLPFRLDHVNLYLLEDRDGFAIVDTGLANDVSRDIWRAILRDALGGKRVTAVISTHHHPDHIGLAGWLCRQYDAPLITSQSSYLGALTMVLNPDAFDGEDYRRIFADHGLGASGIARMSSQGRTYADMVEPPPATFRRLTDGDSLDIGGRVFEVLTGNGHAPEQVMLFCRDERLFLAGDQVIQTITPNISVSPMDPHGDPLDHYMRSLRRIGDRIPSDAIVLPGHQLPFVGLPARCHETIAHHEKRCEKIALACSQRPQCIADLVPVLFSRPLDEEHFYLAFSETHAHVNCLLHRGLLRVDRDLATERTLFSV